MYQGKPLHADSAGQGKPKRKKGELTGAKSASCVDIDAGEKNDLGNIEQDVFLNEPSLHSVFEKWYDELNEEDDMDGVLRDPRLPAKACVDEEVRDPRLPVEKKSEVPAIASAGFPDSATFQTLCEKYLRELVIDGLIEETPAAMNRTPSVDLPVVPLPDGRTTHHDLADVQQLLREKPINKVRTGALVKYLLRYWPKVCKNIPADNMSIIMEKFRCLESCLIGREPFTKTPFKSNEAEVRSVCEKLRDACPHVTGMLDGIKQNRQSLLESIEKCNLEAKKRRQKRERLEEALTNATHDEELALCNEQKAIEKLKAYDDDVQQYTEGAAELDNHLCKAESYVSRAAAEKKSYYDLPSDEVLAVLDIPCKEKSDISSSVLTVD